MRHRGGWRSLIFTYNFLGLQQEAAVAVDIDSPPQALPNIETIYCEKSVKTLVRAIFRSHSEF